MPTRDRVRSLTPGAHGIDVHEFGDGAASAGEHDPLDERAEHGAPDADEHQAGDLGNGVRAGADVQTEVGARSTGVTRGTGRRAILGRSRVVMRAGPDVDVSRPAGNSGARIARGMIRAVSGANEPVLPAT
nr:superoxide dismutase family protein [Nannocystis exedens]